MKTKTILMSVMFALCAVSNLFASSSPDVEGKYVTHNGNKFEISVYDMSNAEEIIGSAEAVYAFKVADCTLSVGPFGNTSDHCRGFKNAQTGEYAIEIGYKKDVEEGVKEYVTFYIIFSLEGARIETTLPEGFGSCNYEEMHFVGYGQKAGWCPAKFNGELNSVVVFVK